MVMPVRLVPDTSRLDWTVEELDALPDDGNRYEVVDGELLVSPSPEFGHQLVLGELFLCVKLYADPLALDTVVAPAGVRYSLRREVQPDLFVLPRVRMGNVRHIAGDVARLLVAVEVLSPSTARADREIKRRLYQSEGVPEYWMVDPRREVVERWRPGEEEPEVMDEVLTWKPFEGAAALSVDLPALFAKALR